MPADLISSVQQLPSDTIAVHVGRWIRKRASAILWILLVIAVKYIVPSAWIWPLSWVAVGLITLRLGRSLLGERPLPGHMILRHFAAAALLILATQRPEAATFSGLLRSNIPSRIALTVQKAAESRIILDEGGAEALQKRGDMLVRFTGEGTVRAHGCRILPTDIQTAMGEMR